MQRTTSAAVLVAVVTSIATLAPVNAVSPVKLGTLDCTVSDSDTSLFSTHLVLACSFSDIAGAAAGNYQAEINRKGLSIGNIKTSKFTWVVATVGETSNVKLDGTYLGAEGGVSAGAGVGGNYLTGGFNKKFSLQPYSVEGKSGFGLEIGGQSLVLKSVDAN